MNIFYGFVCLEKKKRRQGRKIDLSPFCLSKVTVLTLPVHVLLKMSTLFLECILLSRKLTVKLLRTLFTHHCNVIITHEAFVEADRRSSLCSQASTGTPRIRFQLS